MMYTNNRLHTYDVYAVAIPEHEKNMRIVFYDKQWRQIAEVSNG